MTRDEIKEMYNMRDVLALYRLQPDRKGFIHCPFHRGDRDASMKIYDRDFHCFACGAPWRYFLVHYADGVLRL